MLVNPKVEYEAETKEKEHKVDLIMTYKNFAYCFKKTKQKINFYLF